MLPSTTFRPALGKAVLKLPIFRSPSPRQLSSKSDFFRVSEEVQQAIAERRPVVALESTIYTHGFPYPDNLALASRLESLVRLNGGVPATIGILDGVARVGLAADELVKLVSASKPLKVSRRDMGFVLGLKDMNGKSLNGGTTVSGTMVLAHLAGIKVFGTGGLGGVHRGAEQTMDISADLTELGRTPVAVISSGCKSFLDIPKTLEYLETQGVAVATFADGRPGHVDFPAFYTRDSGVKSPMVLQTEDDAARVILAQKALGLQSGLHFANPIPEQFSVPFAQMEKAINQALDAALTAGATGAASTPYILAKIKDITGSKSVDANKALVEANVVRATKVAVALQKLDSDESAARVPSVETSSIMTGPTAVNYSSEGTARGIAASTYRTIGEPQEAPQPTEPAPPVSVFVAGSLAVDLSCDLSPRKGSSLTTPALQTSNPAEISQSLGGVGHNVARAASYMGAGVMLCSAVGDDLAGNAAIKALGISNMSTAGIKTFTADHGARTAQYVAINDINKDLVLAMADMSILETPSSVSSVIPDAFDTFWLPQITKHKPSHLAVDGNWPAEYLGRWLGAGRGVSAHIVFEPVSTVKATGLFQLPKPHRLSVFPKPSIHLATPNMYELSSMYMAARDSGAFDRRDWWEVIDALGIPHSGARAQLSMATSGNLVDQGLPQQTIQLLPFIPSLCCKLGAEGVLLTQILPAGDPRLSSGEYAPYILSRCANETEQTLGVGGVYMRLFPPVEEVPADEIVSVNGVGDTFAGTLIAGLAKAGSSGRVEDFIDIAQRAAVLTLKSKESVSAGLGTLRMLL